MLDSLLMLWYYVFVRKVLKIWNDTFDQMLSLPPPEAQRKLTLIAWQATLYWLWNERNGRLHSNIFRSTHCWDKLEVAWRASYLFPTELWNRKLSIYMIPSEIRKL